MESNTYNNLADYLTQNLKGKIFRNRRIQKEVEAVVESRDSVAFVLEFKDGTTSEDYLLDSFEIID